MHPQSRPLTIGGIILKESDDLVILRVTFDSKMTFEKHLRSVSRAASQKLGILRKSWHVCHGRCFRSFVLPDLEYCCAVWCLAADTHLKLLDRAVSGARFLTWCEFVCDIAHRRSVAVMVLYKTRCSTEHLYGALPGPYVPVRLWPHIGTLMRRIAAEPRSTTGLLFLSFSLWNDLANPIFDGVGLAGFKGRANAFLWA